MFFVRTTDDNHNAMEAGIQMNSDAPVQDGIIGNVFK